MRWVDRTLKSEKEKIMNIIQTNPITTLVDASAKVTNQVRDAERAHPDQIGDTIAQLMGQVGQDLNDMNAVLNTSRRLQLLSRFPLLDTSGLDKRHRISIEHNELRASADIPVYGFVAPDILQCYIQIECRAQEYTELWITSKWIRKQPDGKFYRTLPHACSAVPGDWETSFRIAVHSMALYFNGNGLSKFFLNVPEIPKRVLRQAIDAEKCGFSHLSVVWGPTALTLEHHPLPVDPLLIGKMFDQWWILDQWGLTEEETRLVNKPVIESGE